MTKILVFVLLTGCACCGVYAQGDALPPTLSATPSATPTAATFASPSASQPAPLSDAMSPQAERARIQAERDRAEERFAGEQVVCYGKFAVNDCVGKARVVRREALADLRRQEGSLNAAEAKRRGAGQLSRIEEKSSPQAELDAANRRAASLQTQQARQAEADDKAAARAAAGLTTDARVNAGSDRPAKRAQAQAERANKSNAAALAQKRYADKQQEGEVRALERRKRLARQPVSTAKPLENPPGKSP